MFSDERRIDEMTRIILLCKGHYDREKYPTTLEALKAYYKQDYACADIYEEVLERKPEKFLLKTILRNTIRDLTEIYPDRSYGLVNLYILDKPPYINNENFFEDYEIALFYRIIAFLNHLRMRGNGISEIDTDRYLKWDPKEEDFILLEEILK